VSQVAAAVTLGSTAVSGVFAAHVFLQYRQRQKLHQLAWGIGLLMFSLAALCEFLSETIGWSVGLYRIYYLLAPSLVAVLGIGSAFLLSDKRIAKAFAAYTVVLLAIFAYVIMATDVNASAFAPDTIVGGNGWPSGSMPRTFSPLFTIPGSILLIGIAKYSFWRGRAISNLFIGAGALVVAAGGALSRFNIPAALYLSELTGIALMYAGFIQGVELISRREAGVETAARPGGSGQ